MNFPSAAATQKVWTLSLVIYTIVVIVVVILLQLILREARRIQGGASEIWNIGQKIANNTIHISMLDTTNHVAGQILTSALGIALATGALEAHAKECSGCPSCILGRG